MNKSKNNYLMIGLILLFVIMIIAGAGLCYLSWDDDVQFTGGQNVQNDVWTEQVYESAKEDGRQEVLDYVRDEVQAGIEAEDIITGLFANGEQVQETQTFEETEIAEDTSQTDTSEETQGTISEETQTSEEMQGTVSEETQTSEETQGTEQEVLHKGIDVSKYQGDIDWKKAAADGIEYAFVRVGYRGYGDSGSLIVDEKFHQNMKGVLAQQLCAGAYFFSQAVTEQEAVEEAELVIKELEGYEITYPVAIYIQKVEGQNARQDKLSKENRTKICKAFCDRVEQAGYIPMVYGDTQTFADLVDAEALKEYAFWIYDAEGTAAQSYEASIWQYSHEGTVSGIGTETNLSISYKEW